MAVHLEDIIEETGGCGRYQVILCLIIHCCKQILSFGLTFMSVSAQTPDWWCMDDIAYQNISQSSLTTNSTGYKSCTSQNGTSCKNFIVEDMASSIVSEWRLFCDDDWISATIMSVQMAGVFVGNIVGGHVADLVGRKPPFYVAISVTSVCLFVAIFSTSWLMFAVLRFFIGLSIGFQLTVMYNIQTEFVLPRWRTWVVAMPSWPLTAIVFSLIAWGLQDWKYLHGVGAAVGAIAVLTCWYVPESFRWKVVHDKVDDAGKIIKFVAKINRSSVPSARVLEDVASSVRSSESQTDRKYSILDLFKSRAILKNNLLLMLVWIMLGLGSYGIEFGVQALSGTVYVNLIIVSAINSPLQFVSIYLQNRFGRKKTSILYFSVFTAAAGVVGVFSQLEDSVANQKTSMAIVLVALIAVNAAWSPVQTHTIELYPTVIRNIGYGWQNTMARFGAIIGPQLVLLDSRYPGAMYFACAALGLLTVIMIIPLPETKGLDLQDNLPDQQAKLTHERHAMVENM